MFELGLSAGEKRKLMARMRVPLFSFIALMGLLAVNVLLGATLPFPQVWIVQLLVLATMVAVVLLFSMEVLHEPPLIRLFSVLGFCWVGILFAMTLIDYLTR
ncbi:MAG TPA: oxidase [Lichenihabitans sp.]|jgi:cytochrome c oxidase subunit 4|nr:oxidase [Lichenihabitans sp.]